MENLTENQIIKLIEENLNNKFKYYLDNMMDEKRPFGNSGFSSIQEDMMEIIEGKKTWKVSNEEELEDLKYNWMKECFKEIKEWIDKNNNKFKVGLYIMDKEDDELGEDTSLEKGEQDGV